MYTEPWTFWTQGICTVVHMYKLQNLSPIPISPKGQIFQLKHHFKKESLKINISFFPLPQRANVNLFVLCFRTGLSAIVLCVKKQRLQL